MKSSSNWTKSSMMGPQLFLGWCQMILDVFRCSQLLSPSGDLGIGLVWDNLSLSHTTFRYECWNHVQAELYYLWWGSQDDVRYFQMFQRCFQMFSAVSAVLRMPSIDLRYSIEILRCVQDVLRCSQIITDVFGFFLDII